MHLVHTRYRFRKRKTEGPVTICKITTIDIDSHHPPGAGRPSAQGPGDIRTRTRVVIVHMRDDVRLGGGDGIHRCGVRCQLRRTQPQGAGEAADIERRLRPDAPTVPARPG